MKSRKKPRPLGDRRVKRTQAEEHLEGNVLVCHRLRLDIGDERLAKAVYAVFSRGFVVEAATYGRSEPDCLLIVQGLYDNELADIPIEVDFSDYRAAQGTQVPYRVQRLINNSLFFDVTVDSVTVNSGLSATSFAVPAR